MSENYIKASGNDGDEFVYTDRGIATRGIGYGEITFFNAIRGYGANGITATYVVPQQELGFTPHFAPDVHDERFTSEETLYEHIKKRLDYKS